jgi:hypothetical protein
MCHLYWSAGSGFESGTPDFVPLDDFGESPFQNWNFQRSPHANGDAFVIQRGNARNLLFPPPQFFLR